jgi:hypothetical protein
MKNRGEGTADGERRIIPGAGWQLVRAPVAGSQPAETPPPALAGTISPVLAILLITFPFFALVLCGYVAARRGMLPLEAIPGLNAFVLYFALPCMLYRFGMPARRWRSCWTRPRWLCTCRAR